MNSVEYMEEQAVVERVQHEEKMRNIGTGHQIAYDRKQFELNAIIAELEEDYTNQKEVYEADLKKERLALMTEIDKWEQEIETKKKEEKKVKQRAAAARRREKRLALAESVQRHEEAQQDRVDEERRRVDEAIDELENLDNGCGGWSTVRNEESVKIREGHDTVVSCGTVTGDPGTSERAALSPKRIKKPALEDPRLVLSSHTGGDFPVGGSVLSGGDTTHGQLSQDDCQIVDVLEVDKGQEADKGQEVNEDNGGQKCVECITLTIGSQEFEKLVNK